MGGGRFWKGWWEGKWDVERGRFWAAGRLTSRLGLSEVGTDCLVSWLPDPAQVRVGLLGCNSITIFLGVSPIELIATKSIHWIVVLSIQY